MEKEIVDGLKAIVNDISDVETARRECDTILFKRTFYLQSPGKTAMNVEEWVMELKQPAGPSKVQMAWAMEPFDKLIIDKCPNPAVHAVSESIEFPIEWARKETADELHRMRMEIEKSFRSIHRHPEEVK